MRPPLVFVFIAASVTLTPACRKLGTTHSYSTGGPLAKAPIRSYKIAASPTSGERYEHVEGNEFHRAKEKPRSTFSVDVDTASYANVRRMISRGHSIPTGAVRVEEMVNYFDYDYPQPGGPEPFSIGGEVASCPWNGKHHLVRISLQGREVDTATRPPANLVFLLDVSGSMRGEKKLPLVRRSLGALVSQLRDDDRIAIVTYASNTGVALPSTPCRNSDEILDAIDQLSAGGSTAGASGIELAYGVARKHFHRNGINRVILATDGDFNVGPSSDSELVGLIEKEAKSGVSLSVLGFGMGNLNDSMLEKLSGKGDGNYAYIDTYNEARKTLVREVAGSLQTIAKDTKIQVEFNPAHVQAYRLLGYENRRLEDRDFADDRKDAGDIGAGHRVTAFYEIVPPGVRFRQPSSPELRYRRPTTPESASRTDELLTVHLRYKEPRENRSRLVSRTIQKSDRSFANASTDFRFASAVTAFGMLLREEGGMGTTGKRDVIRWANSSKGPDKFGYREEFIGLVRKANGV